MSSIRNESLPLHWRLSFSLLVCLVAGLAALSWWLIELQTREIEKVHELSVQAVGSVIVSSYRTESRGYRDLSHGRKDLLGFLRNTKVTEGGSSLRGYLLHVPGFPDACEPAFDDARLEILRSSASTLLTPLRFPGEPPSSVLKLPLGEEAYLILVLDRSELESLIRESRRDFCLAALLFLVLLPLPVWLLSRRAMAGVRAVSRAAAELEGGRFGAVLPPVDGEAAEVQQLLRSFGRMDERLGRVVEELKLQSAALAHDLRSPVARLRLQAERCLRDQDALTGLPGEVLIECGYQEAIIDSVLTLARYEGGRQAVERQRVDLTALLRDLVEIYEEPMRVKDLTLEFDVAESLPLDADRGGLQRVFANLLDNAVRHSPQGGMVELKASCEAGVLRIRLADAGPGIPAADRRRIFEPYVRLDASRQVSGSGLGLAIARAVVLAHGGDIRCEEGVGCGACFVVELPQK